MKPKVLHEAFEISVFEMSSWHEDPSVYRYFEMVHVMEGSGIREINGNRFRFKKGSIFIFTPTDCRGLEFSGTTKFCSIRFSEDFLAQHKQGAEHKRLTAWLKQLEHILAHHNSFQEMLDLKGDCPAVTELIGRMIEEYQNKKPYYRENLQYLITMVLNIIARNVAGAGGTTEDCCSDPLINRMLVHINRHISSPEQLKLENLANKFNMSIHYVGEYFRKFTGESLQKYIMQYRMKMVQQRLSHSELTVSQIASELGFTDDSHLSRQFKKSFGINPIEYRRKQKNLAQQLV